jgi:hypothetical protein
MKFSLSAIEGAVMLNRRKGKLNSTTVFCCEPPIQKFIEMNFVVPDMKDKEGLNSLLRVYFVHFAQITLSECNNSVNY